MRAVEDADGALRRADHVHPPEIVLCEFIHRGRPEGGNPHPDGPAGIEHRPHRAVLAGTVDALQHDEQRALSLGEQPVLQRIDGGGILRETELRLLLAGEAVGVARVALGEPEALAWRNDVVIGEFCCRLGHGKSFPVRCSASCHARHKKATLWGRHLMTGSACPIPVP